MLVRYQHSKDCEELLVIYWSVDPHRDFVICAVFERTEKRFRVNWFRVNCGGMIGVEEGGMKRVDWMGAHLDELAASSSPVVPITK